VVASQLWQTHLYGLDKAVALVASLEPFVNDFFSPGSDSAYQPYRSQAVFLSIISLLWPNVSLDDTMAFALRSFSDSIRSVALKDGQNVSHAAKYPNYAFFWLTTGGRVSGKGFVGFNPEDVMGLAGSWKFYHLRMQLSPKTEGSEIKDSGIRGP
jgi:hypothetical protein